MKYIYKLIDRNELILAKQNLISFSRPIFEFKGSEGMFLNYIKSIEKRYMKVGKNIKPTKKELNELTKWVNAFRKSYNGKISDYDLITDAVIIYCGIMNGYCGYYTSTNLDDPLLLKQYLKKNNNKLKDKVGYLRLDIDKFFSLHWRADNNNFIYKKCSDFSLKNYNGYLHMRNVIYDKKYNEYITTLKKYNEDVNRDASTWFTIISKDFEWQREIRLLFLLNSLDKNSSTIGCNENYHIDCWTVEERLFEEIVKAIIYRERGPRFIKLKVDSNSLFIKEF